ncbi:hypothetical protein [Deinococcus peraridilitoris]|uniref:Uncharacterized protein n=1 Tax=Deinococcus peraridilitoris (strain DSM 19664 / LMG 22246 / CIP 109416 / KR-200) TaxID=937777 RepID=L0A2J8_DEIPD|nr:hypothetical protein [Deinococcus peraridilitoris]AFZ67235.1 hypothetical protein Deipe_1713 [Deinococcus peraridilitoris DSM 19664]
MQCVLDFDELLARGSDGAASPIKAEVREFANVEVTELQLDAACLPRLVALARVHWSSQAGNELSFLASETWIVANKLARPRTPTA